MFLVAVFLLSSVSAKHHEDKDLGAAAGAFFPGIGRSPNSLGSSNSSKSRGSAMSFNSRGSVMSSNLESVPIIEDDFEPDNQGTFVHHTDMNHGFGEPSNTGKFVNNFASDSFGNRNEDRVTGSAGFSMNSHRSAPQVDNSMRVNIQPNIGGYQNGGGSQCCNCGERCNCGVPKCHAPSTGKSSSVYY